MVDTQDVTKETKPEENLVEIPDATDEDIEAFLESQSEDGSVPDEEAAEESAPAAPEPAKEPEKPKPEPKPSVEDVRARAISLVKQVEGQELLVQRQLSKLGEIRKEIEADVAALEKDLDDLYLTNPREAARRERKAEEAKDALKQIDADSEAIERTAEAQRIVAKHIKPEELFLDDMAMALAEDGVPPQEARAFVENPYKHGADGKFLVQLQRRARAERALRVLVPAFEELKAERDALKAKVNGAAGDVLKKIEEETNRPPKLNGKTSAATAKKPKISETDIPNLSDEELSELLR